MASTEKTTLKPISEELIHKNGEDNVFCDVLSASPMQDDEKHLGSLYIIGHVKSEEEDMGYMVNLISSLAKREYYSDHAKSLDNSKSAFEHTLKKLNEVLEDFFQNKKFNLSIGLVAVTGENIYISRLGKFEVLLKRGGEIIDILNNVSLFHKDHIQEKEFSNIISGKVKIDDAVFAYYPSKAFTSKKKQIREMFTKADQQKFSEDIRSMSEGSKNFLCCGVCMTVKKVREAVMPEPIVMAPIEQPVLAKSNMNSEIEKTAPDSESSDSEEHESEKPELAKPASSPAPLIIRDMSLARRENIVQKSFRLARNTQWLGSIQSKAKLSTMGIAVAIVFVAVLSAKFLLPGDSKETKAAVSEAKNSVKLVQNYLSQNEIGQARNLASVALISLGTVTESESAEEVKTALGEILDRIDQVLPEKPELLYDLSEKYNGEEKLTHTAGDRAEVFGLTSKNNIVKFESNESKQLGSLKETPVQQIFADSGVVSIYDGSTKLITVNGSKISENILKNPVPALASVLYQDNLYVLSADTITKYTDAVKGASEGAAWLKDPLPSQPRFMAIDGKVYVLTGDGNLVIYFKGTREKEIKLPIAPISGGLLTTKDSTNLIYINPDLKRIMVFAKSDGALMGTYKASNLSDIKSWSLDSTGTLYLLSSDQKVWKLPLAI